jgi:hypothetical protein
MKNIARVLVATVALLGLASGAAHAQTGYQLDNISSSVVAPGGTVTVYVNGCKPQSSATITLESDPVVLATVNAGTNGVVQATVTIPSDTTLGKHTIVVRCTDRSDAAKVVSFPITVGTGGSGLPTTGGNIGLSLGIAAIAAGVGVTLLASTRRRHAAA